MRVLLASDFSESARVAHQLVKAMTLPIGSHVRLVHAVEPVTTVQLFAPSALLTISDAADAEATRQVRSAAKELERPFVESSGIVGLGRAADVVLDAADEFQPDLLIVGSRGHGGLASALLGSVSAELVDRAPCPVLVARKTTLSSLVLAEDGSAYASAGARVIRDIPALAALPVHVVSVVDVPFPALAIDPAGSAGSIEAYRAYEEALPGIRARHLALARDRALMLRTVGVDATSSQREGDAAGEVIAVASELGADCIVIGSRGQTGLKRIALGSVARSVLFHASCSVLIIRDSTFASPRSDSDSAVPAGITKKEVPT